MCPIDFPTRRKKQVMSMPLYQSIVDALSPHAAAIEKFDLFGLGEPVLDPKLNERIRYAKSKGFHDIGISTNADPLTREKQEPLLQTGIDTIIFSIDGAVKETHEAIRVKTDFDSVVENCLSTIRLRDEKGYKTRFVVRFIRQEQNYNEWDAFKRFWLGVISPGKRDLLTLYDAHSWGGKVSTKADVLKGHINNDSIETMACHHLNNLLILSDGSVPLCSEDWLDSPFRLGNVKVQHPLEIFNSPKFERIRQVHAEGRKNRIPICRECTVLYSEPTRIVVTSEEQTPSQIGAYLDSAVAGPRGS
jgi:radical SAM protein with 4Fe4S-binding SPASM domain